MSLCDIIAYDLDIDSDLPHCSAGKNSLAYRLTHGNENETPEFL